MNFLDKRDKSMAPTPQGAPSNDKLVRYRWAKPTTPGQYRSILKSLLNLDDSYQRDKTSSEAVLRIARDWDWLLFRTLGVAERPDKSLWVFDGGHRLRASFYRSDIKELPCMVYPLDELAEEARAFIAGAKLNTKINPIDTFHASQTALEPNAVRTAEILSEFGLAVKKTAHGPNQLKCISTIQNAIAEDEKTACDTIAACIAICNESSISGAVFRGLFRLARHVGGQEFFAKYGDGIANLTQAEIEKAIRQFTAEVGKGGEVIGAKAILGLLNKGKRSHKLRW